MDRPQSPGLIAYRRVSTQRQGVSGLGLEAQDERIARYSAESGRPVLASYTEVESGRRCDRPELARALAHAKRARAALVVAKLDRLARNVAFLSGLMESRVDFVACDQPHANRFTLHILAAVAEEESRMISARTREALAAAKARGVKLGRDNLTAEGRARGVAVAGQSHRNRARAELAEVVPIVAALRAEGHSWTSIAGKLNEAGDRTRAGKPWHLVAVRRVWERYCSAD